MGPRAWTGSWTESPVQTVQSGASMARLRGIRAASARSARAVLLIIRRSWVRAPPAPPVVRHYIRCRPWTDAGGIACRQIGFPGQHLPSQISRQRGTARTRLQFQLTPRPRCGDPQAKTHPRPIGTAPAGQQAFPIRPSKGPEPLKGQQAHGGPLRS